MPGQLDRRAVVAALLADRGDAAVVSGLGAPSYDCFAAGDSDLNFYLWGGMGGAAMLGLGVALAQPHRRVIVITGDGEMMMGIGSLATIAAQAPPNLGILVLDNEAFGETGSQPSLTAGAADLAAIASAAGIARAFTVREPDELSDLVARVRDEEGPVLGVAKVRLGEDPVSLPPREGPLLHDRFRAALSAEV